MKESKEDILLSKGVTFATSKHHYPYLFKSVLEAMDEYSKSELTKFLDFLLKEGYCDTDVYSEPPTAIDQYLGL